MLCFLGKEAYLKKKNTVYFIQQFSFMYQFENNSKSTTGKKIEIP